MSQVISITESSNMDKSVSYAFYVDQPLPNKPDGYITDYIIANKSSWDGAAVQCLSMLNERKVSTN
jgi:hypothetical protein